MQETWSGCWRGRKVGVVGPFHLTKGRDVMWGFLGRRRPNRRAGLRPRLGHDVGALGLGSPGPCKRVRDPPVVMEGSMI